MNETDTITMSQQEQEREADENEEWIGLVDEIIKEDCEILDRLA